MKYDPGDSFRIPDPDPYFLPIQDPGSRGLKGTVSWIQIRYTEFTAEKKLNYIFLNLPTPLSLLKGRPSYRRSLQALKEKIQHFKPEIS
jgi:hypothetical protein